MSKKTTSSTDEANPSWKSLESFVVLIGKWAWVIVLINGIIDVFWGLWGLFVESLLWTYGFFFGFYYVWYLIGGIVAIIFALLIIKRRFSDKCAAKDWDYLFNDVLILGGYRIPWMLIWGIIVEILLWYGGLAILIPAFLLIFMGPNPYKWKA